MIAIRLTLGLIQPPHPWIDPTSRDDKGLAFMDGHHPPTHNYRSACARAGLATPRRSSLAVQKI